jgi:hypothetical protein
MKECKKCENLFVNTSHNFMQKKTWRINKEGKKVTYVFLSLYCKACEPKYTRVNKQIERFILYHKPKLIGSKTEPYFQGDFGEQESLQRLLAITEINE